MRWLAASGVSVVAVRDLLGIEHDRDAVAITFDDAFTNFLTVAWPQLRDNEFPVTLFVPTGYTGHSNDWDSLPGGTMQTLPILDWNSLGSLVEQGVELGAHSRSHPDMRKLSDDEVTTEIAGSIEDIERETGRTPRGFAYPYGRFDDRVVQIARQHCAWACTTELRELSGTDDRYKLPRLDSWFLRGPARMSAYGSPLFRSYLSLRNTVRRARRR